ncbi:hypothetical protein BC940DRAFT_338207 [Gongronella butleri]|nr:hypothetical protein BC940DRAFT_338207 [Gongronella butleri]
MDDSSDEDVADYSELLKSKKPQRGSKTFAPADQDQDKVERARHALYELIGEERAQKGGVCSGELVSGGLTRLTAEKGTHVRVLGHALQGAVHLHLEEAAWLMNRQGLIVPEKTLADFYAMICTSHDGWISFERYQAYAFLKRLGYIVRRAPPMQVIVPQPKVSFWHFFHQWTARLVHWCRGLLFKWPIRPYTCTTYADLFARLQSPVQSQQWHQPAIISPMHRYTFAYDLYKPRHDWKKRDPGVPDFRVVVGRMTDALPDPENLKALFSQVAAWPSKEGSYFPIAHTRHTEPALLMALVGDAEGVSFVRLQANGVASLVDMNLSK